MVSEGECVWLKALRRHWCCELLVYCLVGEIALCSLIQSVLALETSWKGLSPVATHSMDCAVPEQRELPWEEKWTLKMMIRAGDAQPIKTLVPPETEGAIPSTLISCGSSSVICRCGRASIIPVPGILCPLLTSERTSHECVVKTYMQAKHPCT